MPSYCSFLIFRPTEIDLVQSICEGAKWSAQNISDPSMRYKFWGSGVSETTQASGLSDFGALRDNEKYGRLLVLEAEWTEANNIIQLIYAANLILEGFPHQGKTPNYGFEIPKDSAKREDIFEHIFRTDGYFEIFTYRETMPTAVAVAAKAWSDTKMIYAIHKLAQSVKTESVTPHSMHPQYGQSFEKHSEEFSDHILTSIAINLAYSAIQELALDIKSSSRNPRWLDKDAFVWNPAVLQDLEARLVKSGIDPKSEIKWIVRGEKSEVEVHPVREILPDFGSERMIRDRVLSLPDAINSCEYLRNFMTAHAFSSQTPLLGPYEVYNAQQVARFLILSKCGLWNVWTKELRMRYKET